MGGRNGDSAAQKAAGRRRPWFSYFPVKHLRVSDRIMFYGGLRRRPAMLAIIRTFHRGLMDDTVLSREFESTPEMPYTLMIEANGWKSDRR
jgi:hypothetical protein